MTINNLYNRGRSGGRGRFIISGILIALIAAGISVYFMKTKPRPGRRSPAGTSVIVETEKLKAAKRQVIVSAMGTVKPAVSISLKSQVGGKIVWVNPDFVPGGIIPKRQNSNPQDMSTDSNRDNRKLPERNGLCSDRTRIHLNLTGNSLSENRTLNRKRQNSMRQRLL